MSHTSVELYKKYRPTCLKEVVGQDHAVSQLSEFLRKDTLPHSLLLVGNSGTGKTTIARILKTKLNCSDTDFQEMNAADSRGIDDIRSIKMRMGLAPVSGDCRIWLIDEADQITRDGQAAFLKILEDTPRHVYFFLATTGPQKLRLEIKTRCTEIKLRPIPKPILWDLLVSVATREETKVEEDVIDTIAELAEGSARKALVLLHQVIGLSDEEEQLRVLRDQGSDQEASNLYQALMNVKTSWQEMAKILSSTEEDPESIRRRVLAYASAPLLKGQNNARAYHIICCFESDFYSSGKAGLVRACYEVVAKK